jgi:hypothetical protein
VYFKDDFSFQSSDILAIEQITDDRHKLNSFFYVIADRFRKKHPAQNLE